MSEMDIERLKADASGNTGLSEVLGTAVAGFSGPEDAVAFLATRGFKVTAAELAAAAAAHDAGRADGEGGYAALIRFVRRQ